MIGVSGFGFNFVEGCAVRVSGFGLGKATFTRQRNVPQGQHLINRRFQSTNKRCGARSPVPQGRHFYPSSKQILPDFKNPTGYPKTQILILKK